jgi:hypothetical protein
LAPARSHLLSILAASQPGDRDLREDQLISLIRNEIRRLFSGLCQQLPAPRL